MALTWCLKLNTQLIPTSPTFHYCSCNKNIKSLTHSCCVVTKGHTYSNKPVGKSSESTKSEVFVEDFFNKFDDIGK